MALTAKSGPTVNYGVTTYGSTDGLTGFPADYNDQRAPSLDDLGTGMLDPRAAYNYAPGGAVSNITYGFYRGRAYVDYVPSSASSVAFVAATTVTTGVSSAFTLAASSAAGTYSLSIIAPENNTAVTVIAIDSSASTLTYNSFGTSGTLRTWAPGIGVGRVCTITTTSSGDLGTWVINGRDVYGYKMTEAFSIAGGSTNSSGYTITGKKAFKYITSIINATTPVSTAITLGFNNTVGMPFKVPYCGADLDIRLNATAYASAAVVLPSTTTFVLASTAATQTSTTPDVRGTYASTTAFDSVLRLQIAITPAASAVVSVTSTNVSPLFGATQYNNF